MTGFSGSYCELQGLLSIDFRNKFNRHILFPFQVTLEAVQLVHVYLEHAFNKQRELVFMHIVIAIPAGLVHDVNYVRFFYLIEQ